MLYELVITEPEENVFYSLNMLLCLVLTFKKLKFMSMVDLSNVICSLVDEDGTRTLKIKVTEFRCPLTPGLEAKPLNFLFIKMYIVEVS